ncbi:putative electron transport oxidoreductase [Ilyonectria sp. MPI-CAGE-AT-0026]|nr:putative electron transport oxidoreductase [Ilyonectria sp. MPI-CAGE-AT-0026]
MVDFNLSPAQQAIRDAAAQFAAQHLTTARAVYSDQLTPSAKFRATQPIYEKAVAAGLIKSQIPAAQGGTGGALIDAVLCVEELYAVDCSVSLTILATGLGLTPLILAGTEAQRKQFLAPFLGEGSPLASLVHSEPGGTANFTERGGDGVGLQTTARRDGETLVISGDKMWATNCAGWDDRGAELQCVTCRLVEESRIAIILVSRGDIAANDDSCYQVISHPSTVGHQAVSGPYVRFQGLRVPMGNMLIGYGVEIAEAAFTMSAVIVGAMSVGVMRRCFELTLAFCRTERRGGKVPILERQSVADLLISIKMRLDASRALTWRASCALGQTPDGAELAYEAKVFCSDNAVQAVVEAMNAVGVSSYNNELGFGELMNDALCLPLFDGGNVGVRRRQIQRAFKYSTIKSNM